MNVLPIQLANRLLTPSRLPVTLGVMAAQLQWPDPDRRRRRLQVLAALASARAHRERLPASNAQAERLRELIAQRRRLAG